jgi:hypothetical protein
VIEFATPNVWPIYDNWILISKGASRIVALKNGKGLQCKPSTTAIDVTELTDTTKHIRPGHQAIARRLASQGHSLFLLTGKSAVELAYVYALDKGRRQAKLEVRVADVINVPVAFHVVRHIPAGKSSLVVNSSKWTAKEELIDALLVAHQIYRQAAIALDVASYGFADVNSDLTVVDTRKQDSPGWAALRPHSKKSVANIFVVGKVLNNSGSNGSNWDHDCVVDTRPPSQKEFGRLIAHELGHAFGIEGHAEGAFKGTTRKEIRGDQTIYTSEKTRYLMSANLPEEEGFDAGIHRNHVWVMREGAKKIK